MWCAMINVSQLVKRFRTGGQTVTAVNELSFTVGRGEVYGLLGPNGAGKTTTVRMVIGLLTPDDGYAEVGGYRTSDSPDDVKAQIGLVSANDGVYPWLTVREMLFFFADLYGVASDFAHQSVERLCSLLELTKLLDRRCSTLSTGQKQRVTLARGLVHDPPAMLLDEPTRGLDVIGSNVVIDYIAHLRDRGKAVIVCTHGLDEAERLCDRFGLLHAGRLLHEGSLADLQRSTGCKTLVEMFNQHLRTK